MTREAAEDIGGQFDDESIRRAEEAERLRALCQARAEAAESLEAMGADRTLRQQRAEARRR